MKVLIRSEVVSTGLSGLDVLPPVLPYTVQYERSSQKIQKNDFPVFGLRSGFRSVHTNSNNNDKKKQGSNGFREETKKWGS
jgi:hypothetical protein